MMFDLLLSAYFIWRIFHNTKQLVNVEKKLRVRTTKWSSPAEGIKDYNDLLLRFNMPFWLALLMISGITFLMSVATITSTGIACCFSVAMDNSLHSYVRKHSAKFR